MKRSNIQLWEADREINLSFSGKAWWQQSRKASGSPQYHTLSACTCSWRTLSMDPLNLTDWFCHTLLRKLYSDNNVASFTRYPKPDSVWLNCSDATILTQMFRHFLETNGNNTIFFSNDVQLPAALYHQTALAVSISESRHLKKELTLINSLLSSKDKKKRKRKVNN